MKALLLLSQLVIPSIPADQANDGAFIIDSIKTVSCVSAAEADGIAVAFEAGSAAGAARKSVIVTVKNKADAAACAEEVVSTFDGLKVESVLNTLGMFVVSYEVPANDDDATAPAPIAPCFATGFCGIGPVIPSNGTFSK